MVVVEDEKLQGQHVARCLQAALHSRWLISQLNWLGQAACSPNT